MNISEKEQFKANEVLMNISEKEQFKANEVLMNIREKEQLVREKKGGTYVK